MLYLLAGPVVALVGIAAVFFVLRRKSVEKRSMYAARRQQIEHKVRAARQRTLAPRARAEKPVDSGPPSPFTQTPQGQPLVVYDTSGYGPGAPAQPAPPVPPPFMPSPTAPAEPQWDTPVQPAEMPWQTATSPPAAPAPPTPPPGYGPPPAPAAPAYDYPAAAPVEPFRPAPEPTQRTGPSEPAWTPAPAPSEPAVTVEQPAAAAASAAAAGAWSVVTTSKDAAAETKTERNISSSWQLASGEAPSLEDEDQEAKRPSSSMVAVAQYAVLVVGLVMVLIGVLVMVANSHVT